MAPAPIKAPLAILTLSPAPLAAELLAPLALAVLLPDAPELRAVLDPEAACDDEPEAEAAPAPAPVELEVDPAATAAEEIPAVAPVVTETEAAPTTWVVDEPTETRMVVWLAMGTVLMPAGRPAGMVATAGWVVTAPG